MKILMQSPVPICSVKGLSSHEDIDAISSTHLQCYRAEQPWRYWCNPQCPFAVLQCWGAMKILMQSPVAICSVTGLSSHEDIDAIPSFHLQCYRAEQPWRYWCNPQYPFAVWQCWVATKILMQSPVPICSVTGLSSHKNIEAIPSSSFAVLQGWAAMEILMQSPVPICSVTGLSSHEDIDAIPSAHLQYYSAEEPWRYWCNPQLPFAVLQGWAAMKIWCNPLCPFAVL